MERRRKTASLNPLPHLLLKKLGQFRPDADFQEGVGFAVPGLGEDDGGNALPGQVEAGSQAVALEKNNKKLGYKFKKLY